jgi:hypothetical protein
LRAGLVPSEVTEGSRDRGHVAAFEGRIVRCFI